MQLYLHDSSEFEPRELSAHGMFDRGVAAQAAGLLFQRHPGPWTLSYLLANAAASRFWPSLVSAQASGPVSRIEQGPPDVAAPRIRLRFQAGHR